MAQLSCPYCYQRIDGSRLGFLCAGRGSPGRKGCARAVDKVRAEATGYRSPARPYYSYPDRGRPGTRKHDCPHCGGDSSLRACPSCHTPLSAAFGTSTSPLIAMVGAKGTGKTVYLTVLGNELRTGIRRRFGADVRLTGDGQGANGQSPLQWLNANVDAVYQKRHLMDETKQANEGRREPLVFEWRQERKVVGWKTYRTTHLSFYDTAGEDLISQDHTHDLTYLRAADALIVLLDPFTIRQARDRITLPPEAVRSHEDPHDVLSRVTEMLRSRADLPDHKLIPIPVAVAFAKFDAFFDEFGPDHPLVRIPSGGPVYDERAGTETHENIRAVLAEWGADNVDDHLRLHYQQYRYFAVSSLGAEPDYRNAEVDPGGVRPHRVDEPLVWLLTKFGVIRSLGRS